MANVSSANTCCWPPAPAALNCRCCRWWRGHFSTEALAPKALPQHLVVVGGGYIGLELGIAYRKLGARVRWKRASAFCRLTTLNDGAGGRVAEKHRPHLGHTVEGYQDGCCWPMMPGWAVVEATRYWWRSPTTHPRLQPGMPDLKMNGPGIAIDERCQTSMHNVGPSATWLASRCWRTGPWPARAWPRSSPAKPAVSSRQPLPPCASPTRW